MSKFENTILCGDCCEQLKNLPLHSVDLTVTSPPYDNLRDYGNKNSWNMPELVCELYRVTKAGGVVVWIVADGTVNGSETCSSMRQALWFKQVGFSLHDTMIYAKRGFANPSIGRYHQVWEYMFVFSKGRPRTFNPIRDRKNICSRMGADAVRQRDGSIKKGSRGGIKYREYGMRWNIWEYKIGGGNMADGEANKLVHKHPAVFPEALAADHIKSWSNPGDLVLDPMCGSGTVCAAAKKLGRRWIGIDIFPEYCEIAKVRMSQASLLWNQPVETDE